MYAMCTWSSLVIRTGLVLQTGWFSGYPHPTPDFFFFRLDKLSFSQVMNLFLAVTFSFLSRILFFNVHEIIIF